MSSASASLPIAIRSRTSLCEGGIVEELSRKRGFNKSRPHGIDANAVRREFDAHGLGQAFDGVFAGHNRRYGSGRRHAPSVTTCETMEPPCPRSIIPRATSCATRKAPRNIKIENRVEIFETDVEKRFGNVGSCIVDEYIDSTKSRNDPGDACRVGDITDGDPGCSTVLFDTRFQIFEFAPRPAAEY